MLRPERCLVRLLGMFEQGEGIPEFSMQAVRTVAPHFQSAAVERAVGRKGRNDHVAAWPDRPTYLRDILLPASAIRVAVNSVALGELAGETGRSYTSHP